jgi:OmpA-OmpF porin, OOP family
MRIFQKKRTVYFTALLFLTAMTSAFGQSDLKTYQNYDFVAGDKVIFEDDFRTDADGEFPAHWRLKEGQAVVNKRDGEPAFLLTGGWVVPRMKTENYLTDPFTLEFDYFFKEGSYPIKTFLLTSENNERHVAIGASANVAYFANDLSGKEAANLDSFNNKWHHAAMVFKNNQLKVYIDQTRMLVVPDCDFKPEYVGFGGFSSAEEPLIFKNVRIATGGDMNMLGKKFTDAKIITHGIHFDYAKASIRPESMGTLNMIVQVMRDNPDIKFEVGGHTDSDGSDDFNLKLSQQRADAVKTQLIKMGIADNRLTAKGYGKTQAVADNATVEGKANNRRVEFVKL